MTKKASQTNIQKTGVAHQINHTTVYDDNLLPDAEEIERLYKMDSGVLEWLKERAKAEQDFRHEQTQKRTTIVDKNEANNRILNTIGLVFAFLLACASMMFSYGLIKAGYATRGTIFGGSIALITIGIFITRSFRNSQPRNNEK